MAEETREPAEQNTADVSPAEDQEPAAEESVKEPAAGETGAEETSEDKPEPADEETGTPDGSSAADGESEEESPEKGGSAENTDGAGDKKSGKGFSFGFGKNKKDDKRDQQIAELTDRVKRQMAEFENFRKRSEKEKSSMFEMGARDVLEKLLPVVDSFERGLAAVPEDEKESATAVGMDKIYKQLMKVFEELDVKPIEAVGKEFSPDFHNAVMQAEEEGVGENIIVQEFQKGYLYRGSVIRHSMVKVNK